MKKTKASSHEKVFSWISKEVTEHLRGRFLFLLIFLFIISFIVGFVVGVGYMTNICVDMGFRIMEYMGIDISEHREVIKSYMLKFL